MALEAQEHYVARDNQFYRLHYHHVIVGFMAVLGVVTLAAGFLLYQVMNRPSPQYDAVDPQGKRIVLTPYREPNLQPNTLLAWAGKAASVAYTFNFNEYNDQLAAARSYFTPEGWQDYLSSAKEVVQSVIDKQIFIYGVVAGPPVIANQGELPGKGYTWRVQIPFLVTNRSSDKSVSRRYFVVLTIVRVPTSQNPQGVGIDQLVMTNA